MERGTSNDMTSRQQTAPRGLLALCSGMIWSMRPQQWVKNAFVLAPLVFARQALDFVLLGKAVAAFGLFCAISGAVYLLNDLFDLESDRAHPVKRHRPIASGRVPVNLAWVFCGVLAVGAPIAAWQLNGALAIVTVIYFVLNVAYSSKLKHVPFLDVGIIASGFLLRVQAGSFATGVRVSIWLALCTFLLALYLALGKRQHELRTLDKGSAKQRRVLKRYRVRHVHLAMRWIGVLTALAYTAYTFSPEIQRQFGFTWPKLALTVPFTVVGIGRFFQLAHTTEYLTSPTERMLRDRFFILNILGWCLAVFGLVYLF